MNIPRTIWPLASIIVASILLLFLGSNGLGELLTRWKEEEAYNHGFIMLAAAIYVGWTKRAWLEKEPISSSLTGLALLAIAIIVVAVSEIARIYTLSQYGQLIGLFTLVWAAVGWGITRHLMPCFLMILFVIPLPYYLQVELTAGLQLISTDLGVVGLRALSIPVFQTGNVLDLGHYQLQVVEACAGLNYLYPLLGIAYIFGYLTGGPWWRKALLIIAAIPITILMNGFRIVTIGVLVRYWGPAAAEGFVHEFQGLVVFALCIALLFLFHRLLLPNNNQQSAETLTPEEMVRPSDSFNHKSLIGITAAACAFLSVGIAVVSAYSSQGEVFPKRASFSLFPTQFEDWQARSARLSMQTLATLDPTDYMVLQYEKSPTSPSVEVHSAYYQSQLGGATIHSPKVCLPGGGWEILSLESITNDMGDTVNRATLQMGRRTMLVYYWFQQRGRVFASENIAKWYLLTDSLTRSRSDGALVRLSTEVVAADGDTMANAEARLKSFRKFVSHEIPKYVPGMELQGKNG